MTLRLEDKQQIVAEVQKSAEVAFSAVVAEYHGLTVAQMTQLRQTAREKGVYLRVVRNTLARRALEGTKLSILNDTLVGPTILAMSTSEDDMGAAARLFQDFAKTNNKLVIKQAAFDGKLYDGSQIGVIANLPNRHTALTMVASVMQAPLSKFGRLFTALKEKQEAAA